MRPVSVENGPLTFLPASASKTVFRSLQDPYARVRDEEVFKAVSPRTEVKILGEAGDGTLVDSSRCYHYGGRTKKNDRLVVMIQYVPYHSVKETSDIQWLSSVHKMKQALGRTKTYRDLLLQLPPTPF